MGYTHYFHQHKPATDKQWGDIRESFVALMFHAVKTAPFPIQRELYDKGPPQNNSKRVAFNGIGDEGHETMVLQREGRGFQFCKTGGKPYDRAVVALLILAHHYAPDCWEIRSDGDASDWQPTLDWMNSLGADKFKLPTQIEQPTGAT